ncbi:DUF2188 domain-containing protein [Oceanobacillus massiliensis]|uniref:DUF2188 domain-containing protein n=1 Tax=Oceanobacillus massiliensis TaxID=1465765 RepID=UPI00028A3E6F|nr:DUF2188 domain-containing protein [Oceanobacillus massiliensis]
MPWDMNDYPASMKNLNEVTKKKAIDIANAMLDEGYEEGRAIPIAIDQAKEWKENASSDEIEDYRKHGKPTQRSKEGKKYKSNPERLEEGEEVVGHEDGWAVKSSGSDRASEVFDNKQDAISRAKEIAKNKGTSLTIYKKDGSVQDKQSFDE